VRRAPNGARPGTPHHRHAGVLWKRQGNLAGGARLLENSSPNCASVSCRYPRRLPKRPPRQSLNGAAEITVLVRHQRRRPTLGCHCGLPPRPTARQPAASSVLVSYQDPRDCRHTPISAPRLSARASSRGSVLYTHAHLITSWLDDVRPSIFAEGRSRFTLRRTHASITRFEYMFAMRNRNRGAKADPR